MLYLTVDFGVKTKLTPIFKLRKKSKTGIQSCLYTVTLTPIFASISWRLFSYLQFLWFEATRIVDICFICNVCSLNHVYTLYTPLLLSLEFYVFTLIRSYIQCYQTSNLLLSYKKIIFSCLPHQKRWPLQNIANCVSNWNDKELKIVFI